MPPRSPVGGSAMARASLLPLGSTLMSVLLAMLLVVI